MEIKINVIELASELAQYELNESYSSFLIYDEDEDETKYTDEAQEIFDDLYDKYISLITQFEIKPKKDHLTELFEHFK